MVHVCFNMAKGKEVAAEMAEAGIDAVVEGFTKTFRRTIPRDEMLAGAFSSLCELALRTRKGESPEDNEGMVVGDAVAKKLRAWGALDVAQEAFYSSLGMLKKADAGGPPRVVAAASAGGSESGDAAGAAGKEEGEIDEGEDFRRVRILGDIMQVLSVCTGFPEEDDTVVAETSVFEDSGMLDLVVGQMLAPDAEPGVIMGTGEFCQRWLQWADGETQGRRRDEFLEKYSLVERLRPQIKRLSRRPLAAGTIVRVVLEVLTGRLSPELVARCEKAADQGAMALAAEVLQDESIAFSEPAVAGDAILLLSYCTAGMPENDDIGVGTAEARRGKALELAAELVARSVKHHVTDKKMSYPFAMFTAKITLGLDDPVRARRN